MAIKIQFLADVADWLRGLSKSETALDENAKGLEDLMRKAIQLGRESGRTTQGRVWQ